MISDYIHTINNFITLEKQWLKIFIKHIIYKLNNKKNIQWMPRYWDNKDVYECEKSLKKF
jgi:hypothetical protein